MEHNGRDIKDEHREFITGRSQAPYVSLRPEVIASRSFVHPLPDGRAIDRADTAVLEAGTGTVTGTLVDSAGQPPSGGVLVRTGLGDEARSSANDGSVVLGGGWPAAFGLSPCPTLPSIPWASGPRSSR